MASHTAAAGSPGGASFIRRLVFAQESGLLLVILLMMAALTIFGGDKEARQIVLTAAGDQVARTAESITVTSASGTVRRFATDQGWESDELPDGRFRLTRLERVRIDASPAPVDQGDGVVTASVGGSPRDFPSDRGWRVGAMPDGSPAMVRSPRTNKFLDVTNLVQVATFASFFAIMAVGMTAIIAMNGIDLSIGSIYAFAAIVSAMTLTALSGAYEGSGGGPPGIIAVPLGILVACAVGAACGALNGSLIVGLKVHPFIITLGMMAALRGVVFVQTQGQSISGIPDSFQKGFFKADIAGLNPVPLLIMLIVVAAGSVVLSRTVLGRRVYAIGGNETAARYAGIPVGRIKIIAFTVAGMLAGLAASAYVGYYGAATPGAGQGYELQVIAAAVIGGASLSGGRGTALGAALGAVLIQLIDNGMVILEIDQSYNQIVMGAAIVLAVVLDQAKQKLGAKGSAH